MPLGSYTIRIDLNAPPPILAFGAKEKDVSVANPVKFSNSFQNPPIVDISDCIPIDYFPKILHCLQNLPRVFVWKMLRSNIKHSPMSVQNPMNCVTRHGCCRLMLRAVISRTGRVFSLLLAYGRVEFHLGWARIYLVWPTQYLDVHRPDMYSSVKVPLGRLRKTHLDSLFNYAKTCVLVVRLRLVGTFFRISRNPQAGAIIAIEVVAQMLVP